MASSIKVDLTGLQKKMTAVKSLKTGVTAQAFDYFKSITPIRTGNARNSTQLQGNEIQANYSYASKLDGGSSKQAPQGMTKPTVQYYARLVAAYFKNIGK
jgi:hypothetical protein